MKADSMPFQFPQADHLPLLNPPLKEVVCQIRFPPILKILEESPAEFQDMIRQRFPNFQTRHQLDIQVAPGKAAKPVGEKPHIHRFLDKDEQRIVSLGLDFFAVTTTRYRGWKDFADDLAFVAGAIISCYQIPYSTRIGLRYINSLNTENTNVSSFDPDVLDILNPQLIALFTTAEIQKPYLAVTQLRTRQEDGEFTFQSGIVQEGEGESSYPAFVLDFDRYIVEDIELAVDALLDRCDRYHSEIYNAFRWSILEDRIGIFEPMSNSSGGENAEYR